MQLLILQQLLGLAEAAAPLDADDAADKAVALMRARGFGDMADIGVRVIVFDEDEVEDDEDWVARYVKGSVDDGVAGIEVAVRPAKHSSMNELTDSIVHECGHALWELLYRKQRRQWEKKHAHAPHGAEEAFADDFMRFVNGGTTFMDDEALFRQISGTEEHP